MWILTSVEGRGNADYAANLAHGRSIALSAARMKRAPMRRCIRERARTHPARVCTAASKRYVSFIRFPHLHSVFRARLTIELPYFFFFLAPFVLSFSTRRAPP